MKNAIYALIFSAAFMGAASAASYQLGVGEFDDYEKTFMLEDGQRITFMQGGVDKYYAQVGRAPRTRLIPQARGVFLTADGARIEFRDAGDTVAIRDVGKLAAKGKPATGAVVMAKR